MRLTFKRVLFIAILLRLFVTFLFIKSSSEDLRSFLAAGEFILQKKSFYPSLYFPFFNYLGALALYLKPVFNPFLFLKLIFSLFDVGTVWLIFLLSNKNLKTTLIYALNPISLIVGNIHGQFDSIPLFFLMLGIYLFNKNKEAASLLSISAGILTKTWPFLFILPIFKRMKNKFRFIYIITLPLLFTLFHSLVFKTKIMDILLPIKNYRGVYGYWGIGNILLLIAPNLDPSIIQILRRLFLISLLVFSIFIKRKRLTEEVLVIMLFFFSFTLNYGAQWLSWLVPLIIIEKPKFWKFFLISALVYLLVVFSWDVYPRLYSFRRQLDFSNMILGFSVWIAVVSTFIANVLKFKARKHGFI